MVFSALKCLQSALSKLYSAIESSEVMKIMIIIKLESYLFPAPFFFLISQNKVVFMVQIVSPSDTM